MTLNKWLIGKLIENNYNVDAVKELHSTCKEELNLRSTFSSYKRRIREAVTEMKANDLWKEEEQEQKIIDYSEWEREALVEAISKEVTHLEKKLTIEDVKNLAEDMDIPYGAFLHYIPDMKDVIQNVYSHSLLQLKDDIKTQNLKDKLALATKENNHLKKFQVNYNELVDTLDDVTTIYKPLDKPVYIQKSKKV